jgi:hypothetical protein
VSIESRGKAACIHGIRGTLAGILVEHMGLKPDTYQRRAAIVTTRCNGDNSMCPKQNALLSTFKTNLSSSNNLRCLKFDMTPTKSQSIYSRPSPMAA